MQRGSFFNHTTSTIGGFRTLGAFTKCNPITGKKSDNRINALTCTLTLRCTRKSIFTHFNAHCLPRAWCKTSTFQTEISNASLVVWIPFHCAFYNVFWPFIPLKTVSTSFHNEETPVSHIWRDLLVQHNVIWLFVCGPNFTPCKCAEKKTLSIVSMTTWVWFYQCPYAGFSALRDWGYPGSV